MRQSSRQRAASSRRGRAGAASGRAAVPFLSRSAGPLGDRRLCPGVPLRCSCRRARVLFARPRRGCSSAPCHATCAKCRGRLRRGSGWAAIPWAGEGRVEMNAVGKRRVRLQAAARGAVTERSAVAARPLSSNGPELKSQTCVPQMRSSWKLRTKFRYPALSYLPAASWAVL